MKTLRIALMLAAGVLWVLLAPQDIILRYVSLIAVMSLVYTFTVVLFGREVADSDPLAADLVVSLSLSEPALQESKRQR